MYYKKLIKECVPVVGLNFGGEGVSNVLYLVFQNFPHVQINKLKNYMP